MWYALVFIAFMDIAHLQLDLNNEHPSYKECIEKTQEYIAELDEAIIEETGKLPNVAYTCKYIDYRKA
jgi:hypothetical protein